MNIHKLTTVTGFVGVECFIGKLEGNRLGCLDHLMMWGKEKSPFEDLGMLASKRLCRGGGFGDEGIKAFTFCLVLRPLRRH